MFGRVVALGALFVAAACNPNEAVVRVVNGHEVPGRFIVPEAYAAYLEGVLAESRGDFALARAEYERANIEDPNSAEIWARLGAVLCTREHASADAAFARAEALGPATEDGPLAHAECALTRGDAAVAVTEGLRAAELAPNDVEASLVLSRAYEKRGNVVAARQWLRALELRTHPGIGRSSLPPGGAPQVEAAMAPAPTAKGETNPPSRLDAALVENDLERAKRLAVRERVPTSELALRAIRSGRVEFAEATANRALGAEPGSTDARIAALAGADFSHDERSFDDLVKRLPKARTEPTDLGARVMSELLLRRLGPEAARAFDRAYGGAAEPAGRAP
jgi:tetratricopeptide (TPR) repeat protein